MKSLTAILFFALCVFVCAESKGYTTKYDNVNVDQIINNDRLLRSYLNCLLDRGRCTQDAVELKRVLPDALQTECSKCSEAQKNGAKKVISHLIKHKRNWWNELEAKYDKDGTYRRKYEEEAKKENISL